MEHELLDATILQLQHVRNTLTTNEQLIAENSFLRGRIRDLERLNSYSNNEDCKKKRTKTEDNEYNSLTPKSTLDRLRASASYSVADMSPEMRAAFHLVAYSGDATLPEDIVPSDHVITIPVHAKTYVEFVWREFPRLALVLKRPGDEETSNIFSQVITWLWDHNVTVLTEVGMEVGLSPPRNDLLVCCDHKSIASKSVDFCVVLGGDGTLIRAAYAFPTGCPPILAFSLGSLGFLTPFPSTAVNESLCLLLNGHFGLRLRARLEFELHRVKANEIIKVACLNEAVIDRGASSSLVQLVLFSSQSGTLPVTTMQGDGLILASPTGSSAYSLSAGGSLVHPNVPAILVTPICPHSLSFRPILVPDSATLKVQVSQDSRNSAWISFDGRPSVEMLAGDWVECRYSPFPVPAVMPRRSRTGDEDGWLQSLKSALHWNLIQMQKPSVVGNNVAV